MGHLLVIEELVGLSITATDSTLVKAKGCVWHKSSMKKGVVPRSGIGTDARWGYSHTKGWVFGYKLHLTSTTAAGNLVVPLTADVTTANVPDNQMYIPLTSSPFSAFSLPYVYSPTVILRCFIVRIWFRLDSNNALHIFLGMDCQYNRKLALACGLATIPSRRTFDRR